MDNGITQLAEIGQRAYDEALRVYETPKAAAYCLHIAPKTVYGWRHKCNTPNARTLADMMRGGCDMRYILIGRRSNHAEK